MKEEDKQQPQAPQTGKSGAIQEPAAVPATPAVTDPSQSDDEDPGYVIVESGLGIDE